MFKQKLKRCAWLGKKSLASLMAVCLCAGMSMPVSAISKDVAMMHLTAAEKKVVEEQNQKKKINTIVSTDGEHDDMASMIRYLTMANEFNTKAIVLTASAAGHHTGGDITYPNQEAVENLIEKQKEFIKETKDNADGTVTVTYNQNRWTGFRWIHYFIEKYGEVYDNLKVHDSDYPTPGYLESVVKYGNVKVVGDTQEITEGSEYIKKLILENPDGEPLYIQHWGGMNTTVRALMSIEEEYKGTADWNRIVNKINNEVTLYMIWENQAPTYGSYIVPNWPGIRVIRNQDMFFSFYQTWQFLPNRYTTEDKNTWFSKKWGDTILGIGSALTNEALLQIPFDLSNSAINKPESKYYTEPVYDETHGQSASDNFPFDTWGDSGSRNNKDTGKFLAEGDTPAYFFAIDNGLRSYEDPSWGGWAGRFGKTDDSRPNEYTDVIDETEDQSASPFNGLYTPVVEDAVAEGSEVSAHYFTFARWLGDFQAEYSAHAKWSVTDAYKNANHHPKCAVMNGLNLNVNAGQTIQLNGVAYDPDGDELTYKWWRYADADTHKDVGTIQLAEDKNTSYTVPADAKTGDTIHLIFEVSDSKDNNKYTSLKNYKRVVLTVTEKKAEVVKPSVPSGNVQDSAPVKNEKYTVKNNIYKITTDGTVACAGLKSSKASSVVIPSTIKIKGKSYKVTSIAAKAFAGKKNIKQVVIGKNISRIGKKAFYNTKNVRKLTVKTRKLSKKNVGEKAFAKIGSKNYKKLTLKMPKGKKKAYKKLFVQKGLSRRAIIR